MEDGGGNLSFGVFVTAQTGGVQCWGRSLGGQGLQGTPGPAGQPQPQTWDTSLGTGRAMGDGDQPCRGVSGAGADGIRGLEGMKSGPGL